MILAVMKAIVSAIEQGRRGVVATVLSHRGSSPGKQHQKMLVLDDGTTVGSVGGGKLEATVLEHCPDVLQRGEGKVLALLAADHGQDSLGMLCGGRAEVALELLPTLPRLLLCGGGHCALALSHLCVQMGYLYEVHEDRCDMLGKDRFGAASGRHLGAPEQLVATVGDLHRFSHVLVASRGHATDRQYLRALGQAGYDGWVGLLASRRKSELLKRAMLEEDGLRGTFIDAVEGPVGLAIGAVTPAEIAVSIMARVIATVRLPR